MRPLKVGRRPARNRLKRCESRRAPEPSGFRNFGIYTQLGRFSCGVEHLADGGGQLPF
jgi:hypothetical protein